jgi:hypothetical protein
MRTSSLLLAGVTLAITSGAAMAQDVCLQLNHVFSTKVIDGQTLQATDYQHRDYTIHMAQKCVGLNRLAQNLSFRRAAEIGSEYMCIQRGDTLGYSLPGDPSMGLRSITVHGPQSQMQCTIDSVTSGAAPGAGR